MRLCARPKEVVGARNDSPWKVSVLRRPSEEKRSGSSSAGEHERWSRNEVAYQAGHWEGVPHFLSAPVGERTDDLRGAANHVKKVRTDGDGPTFPQEDPEPGSDFLWSPHTLDWKFWTGPVYEQLACSDEVLLRFSSPS